MPPDVHPLRPNAIHQSASIESPHAGYAELHCLTNFTFLRGASHPEELVERASALGYAALAITDECSMAGVVKAHIAAKRCQLKLIIGNELTLEDGTKIILLAKNRQGYGELCHIITLARRRSKKGQYRVSLNDFKASTDHLIAIWIPQHRELLETGSRPSVLKTLFGEQLWLGAVRALDGFDHVRTQGLQAIASAQTLPVVACGDIQMHASNRKPLLDTLCAIRHGHSVQSAGRLLQGNAERYLKTRAELSELYPQQWLTNTRKIAATCTFSLDELRYEYPKELVPAHQTPASYLSSLTWSGANQRWPQGIPDTVAVQIKKELDLINELNYEYYFLTVFDIVRFAKSRDILCQGRGSAANSAVCYCLEITEVDPAQTNLLFERFISKERDEPPDIDVDFENARREEVIQYLYKKYTRSRAALAATVVTYRPKSAIRDVGKALGLDQSLIEKIASKLSWWDQKTSLLERFEEAGVHHDNPIINHYIALVETLLGFPRHLSQHVGGFVISSGPLSHLVPIENAAMPDRTIIQWDKNDLEALGLLKIDILALGMLTAIRKSIDLINQIRPQALTVASIPKEDNATYKMLQRGDSIGVFQVESRAQMAMLPRLQPATYYDLVIQVAIVRPGPIQGKMVHPYLKRRQGGEPVTYANDAVKSVLERTLGVPIFQEQVIKLAVVAAGFTPGEADQLRRAMAAWKRKGGLNHFGEKLIQGMLNRGHDLAFAERLFEQIKGFGDYGFPESHAASFALLVYLSAWLKCHEPAAFYCGLLNSQPMGFYSPSQLIQDARRHQIEVRAVDVQSSYWESTLESAPTLLAADQPAIRLGLQNIKGLSQAGAERLIQSREAGSWTSLGALKQKAQLDQKDLDRLVDSGACLRLSGHRHQSHWQATGFAAPPPLFEPLGWASGDEVTLNAPSEIEDIKADYNSLKFTLGRHPMNIIRPQNKALKRTLEATQLPSIRHGRFVEVAGLVTGRQRPSTASGIIFMTLEDDTGNINVVIFNTVLERFRAETLKGQLLRVKGILERKGSVIHVVAGHLEDLSFLLKDFSMKSRDFH
jgi:error-prone DNA polymerase